MVNQMHVTPKPLAHRPPLEMGAPEKFALHVVSCGHCRSFPRDLCERGKMLLAEVNEQVRASEEPLRRN
jgi:hypothetical protein